MNKTSLKVIGITFGIFVVATLSLLMIPQTTDLVQSHILASNNLPSPTQNPQVLGEQTTPQIVIQSLGLTPPEFTSNAVLAQDLVTGQILFGKNIHSRMLPASTTKLMTALIAVDYYKPSDVLTVYPQDLVGGSVMGLSSGEKISFRSLLYGMLLDSGNDAAFTLAMNYPGGVENFVNQMNIKTQALGLSDTHFQNPAGFDNPMQYSSAYDLAKIAGQAAQNPEISKVVSTKDTLVTSIDNTREHLLHNLNILLDQNGVVGMKTGTTPGAGENFVGLVERNNHEVLTVVLDSTNRFGETAALMDWIYQNYNWVKK